jgi:peptide deformylase
MIKELIIYPDERINIASADVRNFDDSLMELIQDLKDTIEANNAQALAAIQLAIPLSVVVAKDKNGEYLEFINPRIIKTKERVISTESSLYMPNIEEDIPRYNQITFIYQDKTGAQKSMSAEGDFAFLLQRKFDYTFGGTFANKLNYKEKKRVQQKLSNQGVHGEFNATSTFSKREYFKSFMNKLLFFGVLTLFAPLFNFTNETMQSLYTYDKFASVGIVLLAIGYFAYGKYEASKIISCTGCQVVSMGAVVVKYLIFAVLLFIASYYMVNPTI